jgi:hypothetical protein
MVRKTIMTRLGKFYVHNDTITPSLGEGDRAENMMFIVVRNLKSTNGNVHDCELQKGDTVKLGRLKFCVKDFRTAVHPANADLKRPEANASPVRLKYHEEDSENEFQEEEVVEIDCGVVDQSGEEGIQCKVCWSNE